MMQRSSFIAAVLMAASGLASAAITYGTNLVVNGGAEAGTSGWLPYDSYGLIQSVDYGNSWVRPSEPGPADRGLKMFAGVGAYSVGNQMLDLDVTSSVPLTYELSGWLGGWQGQGDNALFYVQFLDDVGAEIGSAAIGPVLPADRGNTTGLYYREAEGLLPTGTRQLSFWLSMERLGGGDNDGYADNLSFVLTAPSTVSAPSPLALLALAALPLWWRHRRTGRRAGHL